MPPREKQSNGTSDKKTQDNISQAAAVEKGAEVAKEVAKLHHTDGDAAAQENAQEQVTVDGDKLEAADATAGHKGTKTDVSEEKPVTGATKKQIVTEVAENIDVKDVAVVQKTEAETKLYKIKFLKDHEFYIGSDQHKMRKGDTMKVEKHYVNLFAQRNIAHILE